MALEAPTIETTTLISREQVAPGFWLLRLRGREIARRTRAAQYVAIDVPGTAVARLPLGVWTAQGDEFSLLFREWGERTRKLAGLAAGTELSCVGPLGNTFSTPGRGARALIAAGGIGIAPFWLLARDLRQAKVRVSAVFGARTKAMLVGAEQLRQEVDDLRLCTDDGSEGQRATVIDLVLAAPRPDVLYGCGPAGMLRALSAHAVATDTACEISMEETFGCSMGTCWGCVVAVRRGAGEGTGYPASPRDSRNYDFARVCIDGTVFPARDVLWLETPA